MACHFFVLPPLLAKRSPCAEAVAQRVFLFWCFLADDIQFHDLTIWIFHQQYFAV